jgi:hypothetical protein
MVASSVHRECFMKNLVCILTEAILVGEPTGARPNGCQENHLFTLPLAKLRFSCSMLRYRFQPDSETDAVSPNQRIDPDWRSFTAGQDAALRWIMARLTNDHE